MSKTATVATRQRSQWPAEWRRYDLRSGHVLAERGNITVIGINEASAAFLAKVLPNTFYCERPKAPVLYCCHNRDW